MDADFWKVDNGHVAAVAAECFYPFRDGRTLVVGFRLVLACPVICISVSVSAER